MRSLRRRATLLISVVAVLVLLGAGDLSAQEPKPEAAKDAGKKYINKLISPRNSSIFFFLP